MTEDPVRLLDDGQSELLRSLIVAGREEAPGAAALTRTLAALGAGAALTTVAGSVGGAAGMAGQGAAGAKGAASSALVVVKWLAVGAFTGTLVSSAAYQVSRTVAPRAVVSAAAPAVPRAPSAERAPVPAAAISNELREIPAPIPATPHGVTAGAASAGELSVTESAPDRGASLAAEVLALDRARQALRTNDAARTLELLNGYEARFPEARMLPEALYLRLEAFTLKGDRSSAQTVARRILQAYPTSPHAARARAALHLDR